MADRNKSEQIYIFGAGGHAKVVADIICRANRFAIAGLVVPNAEKEASRFPEAKRIDEHAFINEFKESAGNAAPEEADIGQHTVGTVT